MKKYFFICLVLYLLPYCIYAEIKEKSYSSTYRAPFAKALLIKKAIILDGTGKELKNVDISIANGKVKAIGKNLSAAKNQQVLNANGAYITPGIIDIHSHLGVYPAPSFRAHSDGNEATHPNRADVWAEHSIHIQDPQFKLALAGGVTSLHILPGSANLFGGRGVTVRNIIGSTISEIKFPNAKHSLKMACGENPKRVYGRQKRRSPSTRMANIADTRKEWIDAKEYSKKKSGKKQPKTNLKLETLAGVLNDDILVQNHCYTAEEMSNMINVSKEFGYKITAFHHAIEAYKIADVLAKEGICAAMWTDWGGFKAEAFDMVQENIAIVDQANNQTGCAIVHSDSELDIQRLNQEMAKAWAAGNRSGFNISKARAIQWITKNPAKALGILNEVGTLEVGKRADLVIWTKDPFSVYSKADKVFIDGWLAYDLNNPEKQPVSDYDLGILGEGKNR